MTEERAEYRTDEWMTITVRREDVRCAMVGYSAHTKPDGYIARVWRRDEEQDAWLNWLTERCQPQVPPGADVIRKALYDLAQEVSEGGTPRDVAYQAAVELGLEEASDAGENVFRYDHIYRAMRDLAYAARNREGHPLNLTNEHYRALTGQDPPETLYNIVPDDGMTEEDRFVHEYSRQNTSEPAHTGSAEYHLGEAETYMKRADRGYNNINFARAHTAIAQAEALRRIADALEGNVDASAYDAMLERMGATKAGADE